MRALTNGWMLLLVLGCGGAEDAADAAPAGDPGAADNETTRPPTEQAAAYPAISTRTFTGGSAKITVSGAASIDQDVALNTQASIGDGEVTWLQFGVSGSESPHALITFGQTGEVGVSVGRGKWIVTAGNQPGTDPQCPGKTEVTGTLVSGEYTCRGLTSYDASTGKMATADIIVRFNATS
jgi:hypothetical protein